ncbi:RIP metalloprotease RseP [Robbsia sp. Bb-Pol-6]|uniref:Zinc metalloprotease n=1 Tax=Robbsia betulipollinis TaxID=2981849 RepID=A0ABT3ZIE9_9BURK|nr:RIP metalloprotease RseP [Robbsia betulipollinis]MCY0386308.1 RIP metalloprotease RseP [Robbsia betulipollinis]
MELITAVLGFIVALGILVVVHEMGHFTIARLAGVKVLRFSIGFGRPVFQHVARNGTQWSVGWLPLGGYVKMLDERDAAGMTDAAGSANAAADPAPGFAAGARQDAAIDPRDLPHAFNRQSLAKRFAIVAAGPVANFLLAILLFTVLYLHGLPEPVALIGTPPVASAAARAGLSGGETVVALRHADDGRIEAIRSWPELQRRLGVAATRERALTVIATRDGARSDYPLTLSRTSGVPENASGAAAQDAARDDADGAGAALVQRLGLLPGGSAPEVASVEAGSPAARAGLRVGDTVRQVNGAPVTDAGALVALMRANGGRDVRLGIERAGRAQALVLVPAVVADPQSGQPIGRIGAGLGTRLPMVSIAYGPLDALGMGARRTWDVAADSFRMFGRMLTGAASLKNLSGPVTIADYAGKSARMGLLAFLSFMALISISLGVLNLLPIPVLDGGHLLYYAVEAVTGRAPSERWQSILQRAGLFCIVALSVVALFNDLTRLSHL